MNIFSLSYDIILPILEKILLHLEKQEKELPAAIKILANEIEGSVYEYPLAEHIPDLTILDDILKVKQSLEKYYTIYIF